METTDKVANTVSRREFTLVTGTQRNRDETDVDLVGTRKIHIVKSVGKGYI